jgi:hypothetical protein
VIGAGGALARELLRAARADEGQHRRRIDVMHDLGLVAADEAA